MAEEIEYVIYVRKSTEDTSGERQAQSIPDQIERCVKYAEDQNLILKMKPEHFEFESEEEIKIEDNDKDLKSRRIYQWTRQYYIIKERMSGKFPGRPKWDKLIKKIKSWEIKWLISYSPDRQARNMVDGGILIDCVDNGLVDLKYTNFNFEPNAAGKMMLWMWFVFSKQYSDKLSEDVDRWKKSSVEKWKSQWETKYGYAKNENSNYVPDGKNFELMKEAFRLKVEDKASDKYIAEWLNANWFYKMRWWAKQKVKAPALSEVWIDPFYYWMYVVWKNTQDLREVEWLNFVPMITEEWHNILMDRYYSKRKKVEIKATARKDEYAFSIPDWMLKLRGTDYALTAYITKKNHRLKMYERAKNDNPNLELENFIQSSWVRYEIKTNWVKDKKTSKTSKGVTISINQDVIEAAIMKVLSTIKVSEKEYKEYVKVFNNKMKEVSKKNQEHQSTIRMRIWTLERDKTEYITKYMWWDFREWEEEIYKAKLKEFDDQIRLLKTQIDNMVVSERDLAMELKMMTQILERAVDIYKNFSSVRKQKLCKLLFSNLYIDNKKRLTIEVNPAVKNILGVKWSRPGLARIELATRGFGDHRSTSELQPYI